LAGVRRLNPRILFALALLVVFLPLVIWLARPTERGVPAEAACVESWNQNPAALDLGQHLFRAHGYRSALMVRQGSAGQGECLLVLSASDPDPEYGIAAFLHRSYSPPSGQYPGLIGSGNGGQGSWYQPVPGAAGQVPENELIDRQSDARAHPNLGLSPSGTLVPY
jgi:hypothetical protein